MWDCAVGDVLGIYLSIVAAFILGMRACFWLHLVLAHVAQQAL